MASTFSSQQFQTAVLAWFATAGRHDLPWQQNISAYRVWISEIMLQQTQVKTVIPYFTRFIARFPDCQTLAATPIDEVLHYWTGLGYYARARNLYRTAQIIVEDYNGEFPSDFDAINALPGIGRSTAGAICAIAYHQPRAILDGNVKRVLARFATVAGWPAKPDVHAALWQLAEHYTPQQHTADYTQAMMDLGATLCTRTKPKCEHCPLQAHCVGYQTNTQLLYPGKKPKKILPIKSTTMLLIQNNQGDFLLEKRPNTGIWGGLWIFPQCQTDADIMRWCVLHDIKINTQNKLTPFRHTFSHYHLDIQPMLITTKKMADKIMDSNRYLWYNKQQEIGLAAPVKKLLQEIA